MIRPSAPPRGVSDLSFSLCKSICILQDCLLNFHAMNIKTLVKKYCTPAEAAEIIGVSYSQVTRYVAAGMFADVCYFGNRIYINRRDVRRFKRPKRGNPLYHDS